MLREILKSIQSRDKERIHSEKLLDRFEKDQNRT